MCGHFPISLGSSHTKKVITAPVIGHPNPHIVPPAPVPTAQIAAPTVTTTPTPKHLANTTHSTATPNTTHPTTISNTTHSTTISNTTHLTAAKIKPPSPINATAQNETNQEPTYRLPEYVVPTLYDLWIKVDVDNMTFSGHVSIAMTVLKPTSTITLHYKDLNVDWKFGRLLDSRSQKMPFVKGGDRPDEEMYDLNYRNKLSVGNYNLSLSFHGDIRTDLKGLSRFKYRYEGKDK